MTKKSKFYIAVDFDGTIVEHRFPDVGPPVPGAIPWMLRFIEAGASLILWTMRSNNDGTGLPVLADAVEYCKMHGVHFEHVNENPQSWTTSNKAYAQVYIDDAGACCPLVRPADARPFVDWSIVGPYVMGLIAEWKAQE